MVSAAGSTIPISVHRTGHVLSGSLGFEARLAQQLRYSLPRDRHFKDTDAKRCQRLGNRVEYRRRGADRAALADTFGAGDARYGQRFQMIDFNADRRRSGPPSLVFSPTISVTCRCFGRGRASALIHSRGARLNPRCSAALAGDTRWPPVKACCRRSCTAFGSYDRGTLIPPARRPCAGRRKKWFPTRRGPWATP